MIEKRIVNVNGSLSNEKRRKCEGNVNNELQPSSYAGVIYHTALGTRFAAGMIVLPTSALPELAPEPRIWGGFDPRKA